MLRKIKNTLTNACILFTVLVFLLYIAGLALVGSTITLTFTSLLLLFALCMIIALCNAVLRVRTLSLPLRIGIHYILILASAYLLFSGIGGLIQNAFGALIAWILITLVYAVFAVLFIFFERKKSRGAQDSKDYQSMFKS